MSNILTAIVNILENPIYDLVDFYSGNNRANNMGDALEEYVKDAFSSSIGIKTSEKDELYSKTFSYLGNTNNPPDIILKKGDAIEVKKIESFGSAIALNSSYPKDKLYANDSRITNACKTCEGELWEEKNIIYIIGTAPKGIKKLKKLMFVYGECYAANPEIYKRVSDKISAGISEISDVELVDTNEIAKIKKVDPLGITDLRVRGMWHIDNPTKVFKDCLSTTDVSNFQLQAIIPQDKYEDFPKNDRAKIEKITLKGFSISNIKIKSPNNPATLLNAKLISYEN